MRHLRAVAVLALFFLLALGYLLAPRSGLAQEKKTLCEQLNAAGTAADAQALLKQSQQLYCSAGRHGEFVDQLLGCALRNKKVPLSSVQYTIALARFEQLNYLEQQQLWDEYFSRGDEYRQQINDTLLKVIGEAPVKEAVHLSSRLLFWQFHRKQEDALQEQALGDLMNAAREYGRLAADARPVKDVADILMQSQEKSKARELYKIYGEKIFSTVSSNEELQNEANNAYQQKNLDLAESLYSVYIERIMNAYSKDRLKLELADIALKFAYKDDGLSDREFAEKIFVKMDVIIGAGALDENLLYTRAFNLEKAKVFSDAVRFYEQFVNAYPASARAEKAIYKLGLLNTYALRDIAKGEVYFNKLKDSESNSTYVLGSIYQLGLLAQWQGKPEEARDLYNLAVEKAGNDFPQTRERIDARIQEIEKQKDIENNAKMFLDLALKEENATFAMTKIAMSPSKYTLKPGEAVSIDVATQVPASGCLQVQVESLWSGDTGTVTQTENGIALTFTEPGTKLISMVAVTPSGPVDRGIDLIDVE